MVSSLGSSTALGTGFGRSIVRDAVAPDYTGEFDNGSVESTTNIDATTVRIVTVTQPYSGVKQFNFAMRHLNLIGQQPTYKIARTAEEAPEAKRGVWSNHPDLEKWHNFDNIAFDAVNEDMVFSNNSPFPGGAIYISHVELYPTSRMAAKVAEWLTHDYVTDTSSSTDGVLGYCTERATNDGTGRTAPALPMHGFKISSGAGTKNKVILASGNHGHEPLGEWNLEGAIEFLLGGSADAEYLLTYNNFFVYTILNPQGRWAFFSQSNPEAYLQNHNRRWGWHTPAETHAVYQAAMIADTGGAVEVSYDFHNAGGIYERHTYFYHDDALNNAYFDYFKATYDAGFYKHMPFTTGGRLVSWVGENLSPRISMSVEDTTQAQRTIADYLEYGEMHMKTLKYITEQGLLTIGPS